MNAKIIPWEVSDYSRWDDLDLLYRRGYLRFLNWGQLIGFLKDCGFKYKGGNTYMDKQGNIFKAEYRGRYLRRPDEEEYTTTNHLQDALTYVWLQMRPR